MEVLWKDRKRFLGMPITFTKYEVTTDRFIMHRGLLRTETDEIMLYRILDIKLVRSLWQKIFGVGTITLYSADQSHNTCCLINIKNPAKVRTLLSETIEQIRLKKGIAGREMYGATMGGGVPAGDEYAPADAHELHDDL